MIFFDFECPTCNKTFEGEFENFDDYKKQMDAGTLLCDEDKTVLKRTFNMNLTIPGHMKAEADSTTDFAKHTMSRGKRPGGKDKIYY